LSAARAASRAASCADDAAIEAREAPVAGGPPERGRAGDAAMNATTPTRPLWMTAMAALCALGVAFLVARDFAIPAVRDVEVWFGFELRGRAALLSAPLHWALLAVGAWAFWTQQRWIALATAVYLHYVALSHLVFSEASANGRGWKMGLLHATLFSALAIPFWRAHWAARAR
jgi:hypothetical protein